MAVLAQFIFLVFFVIIFFVAVFAYRIYRQVHDTASRMRDQMNGHGRQGQSQARQRRSTRYGDGETITDHRDPSKVKRKIFSHNEGEYVDYQEEK